MGCFPASSVAKQDMALWADACKPDAVIFAMHSNVIRPVVKRIA